jgi:hypothetical protein
VDVHVEVMKSHVVVLSDRTTVAGQHDHVPHFSVSKLHNTRWYSTTAVLNELQERICHSPAQRSCWYFLRNYTGRFPHLCSGLISAQIVLQGVLYAIEPENSERDGGESHTTSS